ncbi:hypothetical protein GGR51DRAFT_259707 [Nemania sp. FL0031]|nr:hypothetical protein GGR51DRAFT_259707 [Nemania sp. FL0031]
MAVPGTIQALIAAFSFGILFNAASAALVLHVKGQGSAIYRDGLRLVLVLFLLASSSWALVEFLSTLIEPSATSTCQVAVIFSSIFDQFGRVFVEQYLVWAVPKGDAKAVFSLVPQILVFGRFFVGIAFAAVTRTQFKPTCAPVSSIRAVAITAIALDAVIIGLLSIQAFSSGSANKGAGPNSIILKTKTVRFVVVGAAIWLGTSVTSLLGLETIDLFYRTALPGIGLTILVGLVTILSQELIAPRELPRRPDSPVSRDARDLASSDSTDYPPSRYEDLKAANIVTVSAFATRTEASRGIRRNEDGTFPAISKPIAVGLDVNGNPIQEQLFLPTQPQDLTVALSMVPPLPDNRGLLRSASDRAKVKAKVKNGKLVISNPILEDENMQSSFKKIPTMGLEEAANNDRLRREQYAQRMSTLIASRPAPRPPSPTMTPDRAAMEPKAIGLLERSESIKTTKTTQTTQTSSGLSVEGNASSTGTQLSPGVDAIRRRSPRQPEPTTLATPFRVIRPGEPIRIPIPRPREQEPDPTPAKPEPVKTPLQRRPTTGLPSNPRAQTLKNLAKESGNQKTQTVMFVNNIVYDNPDAVGDIIQGANKAPQPPDSGDSVVNRPRPIPRKSDNDRQVFPAEISPSNQHRRTKSGGSIVSRKSILQSVPGSPTGLPSLPPIPQIATTATRAVPNGIKSMTVEEKMDMFYSTPSTAPLSTEFNPKRRSSVPNLPVRQEVRPQSQTDDLSDSESGNDVRASKASKRTTARTSSLLGITVGSQIVGQDNGLAASFNNRNPVEELGNSWLPGIALGKVDEGLMVSEDVKRRSSPVLPRGGTLSMSTTRSEARPESQETITNWGSVYSPVVPVSRQNARSTYIKKGARNADHSEEVPIIMLDESGVALGGNGPPSDSESETSHYSDSSQRLSGPFHHRLGDDCPTFSARKDNPRPRKMPPPTPLLLNGNSIKRAKVARPVEPSPVESPRAAYEVIQAQLRKFEQLDQESVETPNRRLALLENLEQEMGQLESKWQSNHDHLRDSMSSIQTTPQNSRPASTVPGLSRPSSLRSSIASTIAERRASRRARMQNRDSEATLAPPSQGSSESARSTPRQTRLAEAQAQYMENASGLLVKRNNLESSSIAETGSAVGQSSKTNESREADASHETPSLRVKQPTAPTQRLWSHGVSTQESSKSGLWVPQIRVSNEPIVSYEFPGLSVRSATRHHLSELAIESSSLWQASVESTSLKSPEGLWKNPSSQHSEAVKTSARPVTMRPPRKNKRVTLLPDIIENPEPLPDKRGTLGIFQFPWGEKSENATLQYRPSQVFMPMPGTMSTGRGIGNPVTDASLAQPEATEYSSSFFDEYDEEEGDNFSDFSSSGDDDFDETTLWEIASLLQTDQVPSKNSLLPIPWQSSSPSIEASELTEYVTDIPSDDEYGNSDIIDLSTSFEHINTEVVEEQKISNDVVQPLLWTSQYLSRDHSRTLGLPQQENLHWDEIVTEPTYRIKARPLTNSFDIIRSNKLWSPIAKETGDHKESFLWEPSKIAGEVQETPYAPQQVQTQPQTPGLWDLVKNEISQCSPFGFGLPEPEAQVWQKLVSRNNSVANRSKSRSEESLPSISSSNLWSQGKGTNSITLWVQPSQVPENKTRTPTLFRLNAERTDYRTTSANPAALMIIRKPRTIQQPLQSLQSSRLWVNSQVTRMELDWIAMCSFRPTSPASSPSPRTTSTDAASVTTNAIEISATSTSSKGKGGFFGGWFGKKANKDSTTTIASEAQVNVAILNSDLPELPEGMIIKNLDNIPHKKTVQSTSQHRQRATPRDWSVALHEAVLESYPELRYSRGQTLAYKWNVGAQDEILKDGSSEFNVATRHPVFFGSLKSAAETVHPALTGYRVSVILSYEDAQSATEEPKLRHKNSSKSILSSPSTSHLWAQPSDPQATRTNGLWAVPRESDLNANLTLQHVRGSDSSSYYPMRANKVARSSVIEMEVGLMEQRLWKRGSVNSHLRHPSSLNKNWLDDSVNKRFTRIELRY